MSTNIRVSIKDHSGQDATKKRENFPESKSREIALLARAHRALCNNRRGNEEVIKHMSDTSGLYLDSMTPYLGTIARSLVLTRGLHTVQDLVAEGQIGLLHGLGVFDLGPDHRKGTVLSFASLRAKGAMVDAIRIANYTIRRPRSDVRIVREYDKAVDSGKTHGESLQISGITDDRLESARIALFTSQTESLDNHLMDSRAKSQSAPRTLNDVVVHPSQEDVHALAFDHDDMNLEVEHLLAKLDTIKKPNFAKIMRMYYGLHPYSSSLMQKEIGLEFGVSETRISQILKEGRAIIRTMIHEKTLDEFMS